MASDKEAAEEENREETQEKVKEKRMVGRCAKRIEPRYDALPGWVNKRNIENKAKNLSFWSFFDHGCPEFDKTHGILENEHDPFTEYDNMKSMISANTLAYRYPNKNIIKKILPSAKKPLSLRYSLVMARDGDGNIIGAIHGFQMMISGFREVVILGSSIINTMFGKGELHQMLFCALTSSFLNNQKISEIDYVVYARPYPRLEKKEQGSEDLGTMIFLGRELGFSIVPGMECNRFWIERTPLMLALCLMGREEVPIAEEGEIKRAVGMFYAALANSEILNSDLAVKQHKKAISNIKAEGRLPLNLLPRSPDAIGRIRDVQDSLEKIGSMKDKCENAYEDNPFCAQYLALLKKKKLKEERSKIIENLKQRITSNEEDPAPLEL